MMNKKTFFAASLVAALALVFSFQTVFAHTTIHVGDYDVEVGWVDEPAVVGQRNAVVVNVSNTKSPDVAVDVSKLTVDVTYGGQTKTLELQPLSEDSTNEYIAPILPTVPGQYTVQLRGQLDSTNISEDVQPEEVAAADELSFPNASTTGGNAGMSWSEWLSVLGLISGFAGLVLAFLAFRKAH